MSAQGRDKSAAMLPLESKPLTIDLIDVSDSRIMGLSEDNPIILELEGSEAKVSDVENHNNLNTNFNNNDTSDINKTNVCNNDSNNNTNINDYNTEDATTTPVKPIPSSQSPEKVEFFLTLQTRFENARVPHRHMRHGIRVCGQEEVGISRELVSSV